MSAESYNKRTRIIVDQFKYGLENADKLFRTLKKDNRVENNIVEVRNNETTYYLTNPMAKLVSLDENFAINENNVDHVGLKIRKTNPASAEMKERYSWHEDGNFGREFYETNIETTHSSYSRFGDGRGYELRAFGTSGLTHLEQWRNHDDGGLCVLNKLTPKEFKRLQAMPRFHINDGTKASFLQHIFKENLHFINMKILDLAKLKNIYLPFKGNNFALEK